MAPTDFVDLGGHPRHFPTLGSDHWQSAPGVGAHGKPLVASAALCFRPRAHDVVDAQPGRARDEFDFIDHVLDLRTSGAKGDRSASSRER